MKNLVFILLFISVTAAYGQVETPPDTIPSLKKDLKQPNDRLNQYLDIAPVDIKEGLTDSPIDTHTPLQYNEINSLRLNIPPLNEYTGPPLTPSLLTRDPFVNDYSFYSGHSISDNAWWSSSSVQKTYPGLGAIRTVNFTVSYQPASWLVVSGGAYGSKYNHNLGLDGKRMFNDIGAYGSLKFILHDRIRLNAYGQYSAYGDKNGIRGPMMNMYPQTYYGGSIELKITEKFGVEGGVIRELNPLNGKWENRTFVAPVFYGK